MEYVFSEDEFNESFQVKKDKAPFRHTSGRRIKIFPFLTNGETPTIQMVLGDYLRTFETKIPFVKSNEDLINKLEKDVETDNPEKFKQIVTDLFFIKEENGNLQIRPLNIEMMSLISCEDKYRRLSEYMSSVLGTFDHVQKEIEKCRQKQDLENNVLENFIKDEIELNDNPDNNQTNQYFKVINSFDECFNSDFSYIVESGDRVKEYLEELLCLYYINYTIQASVQLNNFFNGNRSDMRSVYYCLEWEKTNQNRLCYKKGWKSVQDELSKMFIHVNVLEMLNLTEDSSKKYDYIYLRELLDNGLLNDSDVSRQIKHINDLYTQHIKCNEFENISYEEYPYETESAIRHLFKCVEIQFQYSSRHAVPARYARGFTEICKKKYNYIQTRGRSGDMLCLSEDRLIFLTKLCIKKNSKMRLNKVFEEFSKRGIFLDSQSKAAVTDFYERLNLIEKKSDSGDAQYVKQIL